ncbi:peptidase inhibitor family I36 protein [Streptomyces roseifaciens]|uniref:peptidase inhibitor family I36 protein n=1 Tax=Streptomyces roseifaciens TaxID=1488406 RepID=UPI000717E9BD|nr:peptidase inhibitor family I36 protein [Streptomyces roseifaciens]
MKRLTALLAAALISTGAVTATASSASAAECRRGYFCVWTHANFDGMKIDHSGDDRWWEGNMSNQDSSWANHGVSGPGVPDHVKIYDGRELTGGVTLCLGPGQEVSYSGRANDRGSSHTWAKGC